MLIKYAVKKAIEPDVVFNDTTGATADENI